MVPNLGIVVFKVVYTSSLTDSYLVQIIILAELCFEVLTGSRKQRPKIYPFFKISFHKKMI